MANVNRLSKALGPDVLDALLQRRVFLAVAECGSLTQAADRLEMSTAMVLEFDEDFATPLRCQQNLARLPAWIDDHVPDLCAQIERTGQIDTAQRSALMTTVKALIESQPAGSAS